MKLFDVLEKKLGPGPEEQAIPAMERVPLPFPPDGGTAKYAELKKHTESPWGDEPASRGGNGLSSAEAGQRLAKIGPNVLRSKKKISPAGIFFAQYKDIMTLILLVCTAVSVFMGEYVEAIAIGVIVLMNGILGFIQEFRTERTLEALKSMASPSAKVLRDGRLTKLQTSELVPGDVVLLETGDRVPADGLLLSAVSLECDESMLTGESIPVKKQCLDGSSSDKAGCVYMGCVVTKGHCRYQVTATGMQTEMGNIASMLQEIDEEQTPLQKRLAQLSKYIAAGCLLVCAVVSLTGVLRGENLIDMLITGVSLAVAAVPEGLTAVVTICLALSVSRMVKRNALVRRLHAVETLGCATVICTDKTGTLTQNRMTATDVCLSSGRCRAEEIQQSDPAAVLLLQCITLCNNAVLPEEGAGGGTGMGGHTELALLGLSKSHGITGAFLLHDFRRVSEQPFDSGRKRMSVVVEDAQHQRWLFVKGAFDILLDRCTEYQHGETTKKMLPSDKRRFMEMSGEMADEALRVIGAAYRKITPLSPSEQEEGLVFLGMVGMIDPPRPEVRKAVSRCFQAGIKTIMITGDHKKTAAAIARQVGIYHDGDLILTGEELDRMNVAELSEIVNRVSVFARVSPNHKLQIVKALKRHGHVVAMTGDGVNDAPAIKEADIGVSMGISGTDVTKEASEIILLDDNFATLVNAVDEGRSIYANIRKFIRYLLSCNIGEVLTMFLGMLFGMPVILFPIQILLVNLVTDGLPAIALGLEPSDTRAMSRPPRKPGESVFSNGLAGKIIIRGIFIGLATLASFVCLYSLSRSVDTARTGALFALIFAQLLHVFECKSEDKNILHIPYFDNKKLLGAAALSLVIVLGVLYFPGLQAIFSTVPLRFGQLMVPVGFCLLAPVVNIFFTRQTPLR